jgi:hypothetical protein
MVVRKGGNRMLGKEYEAETANTFVMKACKDASYFVVGMRTRHFAETGGDFCRNVPPRGRLWSRPAAVYH